jgi:pimeloyl-ACP methyl ester carboxylesterase
MEHLGITEAHFIAFSRGVAYVLQYALLHPKSIQGLIIGDYQSHYPKLNEDWAKKVVDSYEMYESWDSLYTALSASEDLNREEFEARKEDFYIKKAGIIQKRYSKELPIRMQLESEDHDLSSALDNIQGQLLILKGTEEGSLLSDEQLKVYQKYKPNVVRVNQAGHDVFEPRKQVKKVLMDYFNHVI